MPHAQVPLSHAEFPTARDEEYYYPGSGRTRRGAPVVEWGLLSSTTVDVERSRSKRGGGVALVAAMVLFAHAASLANRFLLDDFVAHRADPALRTLDGLLDLVAGTRSLPDTEPQGPVFRPVSAAFDWLSWQLVRGSPFAHHALDVLLHVGIAVLLFELVAEVGLPRLAPFAAALFGVHPLTTAAVAPLAGRPLLLGAFALLGTHRLLRHERGLVRAALLGALGAVAAVGSHEAYHWAAPLVLGSAIPMGERRRFLVVLLAAALASFGLSWWSPPLSTGDVTGVLGTTVALLARFTRALVWPPPPVVSFTPSAPSLVVVALLCAGVMALLAFSWSQRRVLRGPWLAGMALGLLVPVALGVTASAARSASDRGAYVVLLGAVLLAASFATAVPPRILESIPPWTVLGFLALVPLDAANSLDLSDELTIQHRLAEGHDEEAALARATLDSRAASLPACLAYARSHGPSTRAHGCVAAALLDGQHAAEALPWARAYEHARPQRRQARVLLLQTLTALNRTAEIQALLVEWGTAASGDADRSRAPRAEP